jgi:hypothetical protein
MNSAKIYQMEDGFLITTDFGNYELSNAGMKSTTRNGGDLQETVFDVTVQGMIQNAKTQNWLGAEAISLAQALIQEKSEDFE